MSWLWRSFFLTFTQSLASLSIFITLLVKQLVSCPGSRLSASTLAAQVAAGWNGSPQLSRTQTCQKQHFQISTVGDGQLQCAQLVTLLCLQAAGSHLGIESPSGRQDSIPRLASVKEEAGARAPLVVSTLRALSNLTDEAFRKHLRNFFPLLTRLIACQHTPPEVQAALSGLFIRRIGPLVVQSL